MVHLKLTADHPPEVQEVSVMRDAVGRKTVRCTAEFPPIRLERPPKKEDRGEPRNRCGRQVVSRPAEQGTVALTVSVPPGVKSDPLWLCGLLAERLHSAASFKALRRDLRQLIRSLE